MKKFITILFVTVIIANICKAQISKGSMLIGGDLGVNSISSTYVTSPKDHSNGFYFSPSFATAIKTNLFVGVYGGVNNYSNSQASYPNFSRQINYSYGILVRKYKTLKGGFSLYLQGNLGGNTNKYETNYFTTSPFTDTQKGQGVSLSFNPGISYQVRPKIQVEAGFQSLVSFAYTNTNFTSNNPQYTGAENQKTFAFNSSINNFMSQVYLGFRFLLQKNS